MTDDETTTVSAEILDTPSKSKGWGRYKLEGPSGPVVRSRTGNEWLYAGAACGVEAGSSMTLTIQVGLTVGRSKRQEVSAQTWNLVADSAATVELGHKPGSQGTKVRVTGARLAGGDQ